MPLVPVANVSEIPAGKVIEVRHNGRPYAVCNMEGSLRAMDGTCPHTGGPMGQGEIDGNGICCPWHSWVFDTETGSCLFNPQLKLPVYPVKVEDGKVFLELPQFLCSVEYW